MMQIQKQTHEGGAGKPELPKGIGNQEVARRMQHASRKHSAGAWPQGYDLTSFLHGDDPQAQHSPLPWETGNNDKWVYVEGQQNPIAMLENPEDAKLIVRAVNHVEQLADCLRDLRARVVAERPDCLNTTKADDALAAYERSKQQ